MKKARPGARPALLALVGTVLAGWQLSAMAGDAIDMATVLRLARAENLDVRLAREKVEEAKANHLGAVSRFLPWISAGIAFRRHEGRTQAVDGTLLDVDKQSTSVGPAINAQVDLGDAIFGTLAAKQLVAASEAGLEAQRQDSAATAAVAYYELLRAQALVSAQQDAVSTSESYESQLRNGVEAGIAFKGDLLRVETQTQRYRTALSQARQQQRVSAARLAEVLHLDPAVELEGEQSELVPLVLVPEGELKERVQQALRTRAEIRQGEAAIAAAKAGRQNAVYGALIPSVGAQAFFGEMGGGKGSASGNYGSSRDYTLGLSWRIGPGGLFDVGRIRLADTRLNSAQLNAEVAATRIQRQVVEATAKLQSADEQLSASGKAVSAATETLQLTRGRKQLGFGVVLEDIQAQQELVRARSDYVNALAEHGKAEYELSRALGSL